MWVIESLAGGVRIILIIQEGSDWLIERASLFAFASL
jgi:hypothetical protein